MKKKQSHVKKGDSGTNVMETVTYMHALFYFILFYLFFSFFWDSTYSFR